MYVVLFVDGKVVGIGRLLFGKSNKIFIIGRVVVLKKYRKLYFGSKIISVLEEKVKILGGISIELLV